MIFFWQKGILKIWILVIFLMCWTQSCSDFLEEDLSTIPNEQTIFTNEEGLLSALAGVYKPMSYTWQSGYANASTLFVLMGSDDLTYPIFSNKGKGREFDQYFVSEQNYSLRMIWRGAYKSIQGSNHIIANCKDLSRNESSNESTMRQVLGEAYYLRAYNYFWIVRLWGDAPLVLESHTFNKEDLSLPRSPALEIYKQVMDDLQRAETLLDNEKPAPGRVGKGSAKALLAEVYLAMTGWPVKNRSYYELAADKAREILDSLEVFGFRLMDDFADLWPTDSTNYDGNQEEIFASNFWAGDWWNVNALYGASARPSEDGGWDDFFCELTFYNEFPEGYRKKITFLTELEDGTKWQDFHSKHPHYAKFRGPEPEWHNMLSIPLERLAEVYLVFAEAKIMATGNPKDPDALEAVNKIARRGAGLPPDKPNASVDWTSATQEQIVTEKGWEFAGEFCRWFDLVRLEMVEEVVAKKHPDDPPPIGSISYTFPIPNIDSDIY